MAVLAGVETAVRMHLRRGDDPNARDGSGMTPLMLAASRNKPIICEILMSSGANPYLVDSRGRDALAIAKVESADGAITILEPFARPMKDEVVDSFLHPEFGNVESGSSNDDGPDIDVTGWEAEDDCDAPENDESLFDAAITANRIISAHVPIDTSEDWGGLDVFLPDRAVPIFSVDGDESARCLSRLFRRALDEGSVPEALVVSATVGEDGTRNLMAEAVLRLALGDIGAETDERVVLDEDDESWWGDEDLEEEIRDAMTFVEDIGSGRNEPMRHYIRDMRGTRLLTAEEEVAIGRCMEEGIYRAIDALGRWPAGLDAFFATVEQVRSGTLDVDSVWEGMERASAESQLISDEIADEESDESIRVSETTREFLERAAAVEALASKGRVPVSEARLLREALVAVRLSPSYLLSLGEAASGDNSAAAIEFAGGLLRYSESRETMINSNLRLVISMVKRYQGHGLAIDDLIQEGNIGLMKAVERYDWHKGFRFSTYATWWIRQQAARAVADQGKTIRTPVHVHDTALRVQREADILERMNGAMPSLSSLSDHLSMSKAKVVALLNRMTEPVPLHEPDDEGVAPMDNIFDESERSDPAAQSEHFALANLLCSIVSELEPQQAKIISLRFGLESGDPMTLEETGRVFNVTRERIRQIEATALKKLAHPVRADMLRQFLDLPPVVTEKISQPVKAPAKEDVVASLSVRVDVPALPMVDLSKSRSVEIDELILRLRAAGAEVDDRRPRGGITVKCLWRGAQTRTLIRMLLAAGFTPYPGMEYRI